MVRAFDIPEYYGSELISSLKKSGSAEAAKSNDLSPFVVDLGPLRFKLPRYFGFCFGVENAIETAYRALRENPGKRVFLLSEMIHNPHVNRDLESRGVKFLRDSLGKQVIPFSELTADDVVIVPAFGTTVELSNRLAQIGLKTKIYDTTCPFVKKVWRRSSQLGERGYTIILHGKHSHEETQATFSQSALHSPTLIIWDTKEAHLLASFIRGERNEADFEGLFANRYTEGFSVERHLRKIGIVNQTTMLASETKEISAILREAMSGRYKGEPIDEHFADTRDTLCYATEKNQSALVELIKSGGDLALVVGGYNSSNTSHLAELCEAVLPTYYIQDANEILDKNNIRHKVKLAKCNSNSSAADNSALVRISSNWLPERQGRPLDIIIAAGASCPDSLIQQVINRVADVRGIAHNL